MRNGFDYSDYPPGRKAIRDAGGDHAERYLADDWRGINSQNPGELADLTAGAIDVAVVYESTETRWQGGEAAGVVDATYAQNKLLRTGLPAAMPIYFAVDWDVAPSDQAAIDAYLRGAAEVIGAARVGVYGGYWPLLRCKANNTAAWFWQTTAWSGGNLLPGVHLYQHAYGIDLNGTECDADIAYQDDFGQAAKHVAPPPVPVPEPVPQPAAPVPTIPWGPQDVGPHDLKGVPAYAFYGEATALRNVPVHVGASKRSTAIGVINKGETATIRGTFRNHQARWALIDLGDKGVGRAYLSAFAEDWPCPDVPKDFDFTRSAHTQQ